MLLMGDEVRRTQQGNNNAYCHDNELSWFDWTAIERHAELFQFVKGLIHLSQSLKIFRQERILALHHNEHHPYITWHGIHLDQPDWGYHSHSLAFTLHHPQSAEYLHVMLNAYWKPLKFELPPLDDNLHWYRIVDTAQPLPPDFCSLPTPTDFCGLKSAPKVAEDFYALEARSVAILFAT
jgi:glycogen operon protein